MIKWEEIINKFHFSNISFLSLLCLLLLFTALWLPFKYLIPSPIGYRETMLLLTLLLFFPLSYFFIKKGLLEKKVIGFTLGNSPLFTIISGVIAGILPYLICVLLKYPYAGGNNNLYDTLTSTVYAPVWEEFYFRGLFFTFFILASYKIFFKKAIENSKSYWVLVIFSLIIGIMATTIFFTLIHTDATKSIFFASISYNIVYFLNGSLISPIIAHSIYNLLVILRLL